KFACPPTRYSTWASPAVAIVLSSFSVAAGAMGSRCFAINCSGLSLSSCERAGRAMGGNPTTSTADEAATVDFGHMGVSSGECRKYTQIQTDCVKESEGPSICWPLESLKPSPPPCDLRSGSATRFDVDDDDLRSAHET